MSIRNYSLISFYIQGETNRPAAPPMILRRRDEKDAAEAAGHRVTVNDGDRNDSEKDEERLGRNSGAVEGEEGDDDDVEEKREQEQEDTTRSYEQVGAEINEASAAAGAGVGSGAGDARESFPNKSLKTDSGNSGNSDPATADDGTIGKRALDE